MVFTINQDQVVMQIKNYIFSTAIYSVAINNAEKPMAIEFFIGIR
jgi:hypothetical protein